MFIVTPFKVKNPPKAFPYATIGLIAMNVIVFAFTSEYFLVVRRSVVDAYALKWGVSPPITFLTSMFLHGSTMHLLGNMLFLWVFGPAVEDRLTIPSYLALYFITGFAADAAQAAFGAVGGAPVATLGASGCIMGVLGAYWYLFSWSSVCMFYFIFCVRVWYGVFDVAAVWIISAYFALDLINGLIGRAAGERGGVANFAHVGGALAGVFLVWALRFKRDTGDVSQAKAAQAVLKDFDAMTTEHIRALAAVNPDDEDIFIALARRAAEEGSKEEVEQALAANRTAVLTRCQEGLARYIVALHGSTALFSAADLIYLGKWCESTGRLDFAMRMYDIVEASHQDSPELEVALFRKASIFWRSHKNPRPALERLDTLLTKFPAGRMMFDAEDLRDEIKRAA